MHSAYVQLCDYCKAQGWRVKLEWDRGTRPSQCRRIVVLSLADTEVEAVQVSGDFNRSAQSLLNWMRREAA